MSKEILSLDDVAQVYGDGDDHQGEIKIKAEEGTKLIAGIPYKSPTQYITLDVAEWALCFDNGVIEILPRTKGYAYHTDYAVRTGIAAIQMPGRNSVIIKGSPVPSHLMIATLKRNAKVEQDAFLSTRKVADLGINKAAN